MQTQTQAQMLLDEQLARALDTDGNNDNSNEKEESVNDWDLPLAVAAAEEAKERDEEKEDEEQVEYEDLNDFTTTTDRDATTNNHTTFSVDHIASLSAVQRKDAIEEAQRRQRLQSRREFMPAAANPMDFSSAQVKNFLKTCRLNKDIHAVAKRAAEKDSHGLPGEVMASDRTTRVELIREKDDDARRRWHHGSYNWRRTHVALESQVGFEKACATNACGCVVVVVQAASAR